MIDATEARRLLSLSASPILAAVSLVTALLPASPLASLCSATGEGAAALTTMPTMYLLMSVLHAGPWLRLLETGRAS